MVEWVFKSLAPEPDEDPERHLLRAQCEGVVVYEEWPIVRKTPAGWWIQRPFDIEPRWTNGKFASPTKAEALARLKARARSYAKHCGRRLYEAQRRLHVLGMKPPRFRAYQPSDDAWPPDAPEYDIGEPSGSSYDDEDMDAEIPWIQGTEPR